MSNLLYDALDKLFQHETARERLAAFLELIRQDARFEGAVLVSSTDDYRPDEPIFSITGWQENRQIDNDKLVGLSRFLDVERKKEPHGWGYNSANVPEPLEWLERLVADKPSGFEVYPLTPYPHHHDLA